MEPVGVKKFYGDPSTSAVRRFRLQKDDKITGKPIVRSLQPLVNPISSVDVKRKRPTAPRRVRVKVPEEPEILTLSSDDEENQGKKQGKENQLLVNGISSNELTAEAKALEAGVSEESDNMEESKNAPRGIEGGGLLEQAINGSLSSPYVLMECRTIRIGTYKNKPSERVVISAQGMEFTIPLPTGAIVTVSVPLVDIVRVLVSFCRSMPVVFVYLRGPGSARVREVLQMTDPKSGYYYDSDSADETHKRITFLPERITEDNKLGLKKIFTDIRKNSLVEIQNGVANEILVKSSPREGQLKAGVNLPTGEIQTIMIYPPPPAKGGISINTEDYACLGEDQFLNDVIIDFYLKYLMQSVMSESDRERTHLFSTFFYKRLTTKPKTKGRRHPIEDDPKLSPAEKRHARVKTWTKNVNLFSKDYVIIPINENSHWFLAIICFPGQEGCLRMSDNTPIDIPKPQPSSVAAAVAAAAAAAATTHSKLKVKDNVMSIGSTTITPVKAPPSATITLDHNGDDGSDRDEAEGDEEEMDENATDDEDLPAAPSVTEESNGSKVDETNTETSSAKDTPVVSANATAMGKKAKTCLREGVKMPCILIFDSLVGAPRYRVAATLREYLSIEYKVKEGKTKAFTKDTIKGMLPKVPQQTNFTDCGLYLLQYVEMFFKEPIRDYHPPIKQLINWFPEEVVSRKREDIVNLLHDLMKEQNKDPSTLSLPHLTFTYGSTAQLQAAEDEEARSRLAEAEAEADAADLEIAKKQLAQLRSVPYVLVSKSEPVEQDVACESAEVVLQSSQETVCSTDNLVDMNLPDSQNISEDNVENGVIPNSELNNSKQSLVDYSESSNDSTNENSPVKRTQTDDEDSVERKKRKPN